MTFFQDYLPSELPQPHQQENNHFISVLDTFPEKNIPRKPLVVDRSKIISRKYDKSVNVWQIYGNRWVLKIGRKWGVPTLNWSNLSYVFDQSTHTVQILLGQYSSKIFWRIFIKIKIPPSFISGLTQLHNYASLFRMVATYRTHLARIKSGL